MLNTNPRPPMAILPTANPPLPILIKKQTMIHPLRPLPLPPSRTRRIVGCICEIGEPDVFVVDLFVVGGGGGGGVVGVAEVGGEDVHGAEGVEVH